MIHEDELSDAESCELQLEQDIARSAHDPLGFVNYSFPWGEGDLMPRPSDPEPGPDAWQIEVLTELGKRLRDGSIRDAAGAMRYVGEAIQFAVASGHNIGKSALICWIILWAMATFEDTRGVVTANTKTQLTTKTWAELAKWHRLFIANHWFKLEKTSLHSTEPGHEETWRIDAVPWSKSNPEAFAGLHNQGKRTLIVFDEASAIEDVIWETTEGATTDADTEVIWLAFGNPTRNTGRFRECFRKFRARWKTWQIDSRTAKAANKKSIAAKIEDWGGVLSDYIKVRVLGQFPSAGDLQFISQALVDAARGKHLDKSQYGFAPVIIGVDPAWTGGDPTVIYLRQGLMVKKLMSLPKNDDDNIPAGHIARFEDEYQADAVFIDQGWGTGIYSAGKQMGRQWNLVSFGESSTTPGFLNKRAEMWAKMKRFLIDGGAIPDEATLCEDLIGPEFVTMVNGLIKLESKDDMKDRGLPSPNDGDAVALTFARDVKKKQRGPVGGARGEFTHGRATYNPLA